MLSKKKKEILKKLENTYCRLQPSKIEGVGVFAVKNIPKGINPMVSSKENKNARWHEFKMPELKNLDEGVKKMIDDFFVIEKDQTVMIPEHSFNNMDISFFINNSKKPNMKTVDNGFTFITLRKIKKGEELTVAYETYDYKYKKKP